MEQYNLKKDKTMTQKVYTKPPKTIFVVHLFILPLFIIIMYVCPAYGDMGRILTDSADVREDSQKAIIFHNFDEEVLILGTELVSDRKTKILRFIPLPSEPKVSLAEGEPFERVSELIKKHHLAFLFHTKSGSGASSEPVELRFNAKLGAHDVTVVKINQIDKFGNWVQKFLNDKGLSLGKDYQGVEEIAENYVKRDIKYFVFDLVDVAPEAHFVKPLVYRFKSRKLYYPLKTSNTFGGAGGIDLILISPVTLCEPLDLYPCMNTLGGQASTSAYILRAEAESVYAPAREFFRENGSIFMQFIRYHGKYDFNDDILIDISQSPRTALFGPPPEVGLDQIFSKFGGIPGFREQVETLEATIAAIEIETGRFELKLKAAKEGPGNPENALFFENHIDKLRAEYWKHKEMSPADYIVPEKKTVKMKMTHVYQQGDLLEIKGISRSGPFYHVAGIKGNNYQVLIPGKTYQLTICPVYPRDYPFQSYYVYIEDFK
jgi:hypothetical protein